jgi:hypothetical protein
MFSQKKKSNLAHLCGRRWPIPSKVKPNLAIMLCTTHVDMGATHGGHGMGPKWTHIWSHPKGHVIFLHFRNVNILIDVSFQSSPFGMFIQHISHYSSFEINYSLKHKNLCCIFVFNIRRILNGGVHTRFFFFCIFLLQPSSPSWPHLTFESTLDLI